MLVFIYLFRRPSVALEIIYRASRVARGGQLGRARARARAREGRHLPRACMPRNRSHHAETII